MTNFSGSPVVELAAEYDRQADPRSLNRRQTDRTDRSREKPLVEIDQIEPFGGTREGRIEPAQPVGIHPLVAEQKAVHKDGFPLPALRLMAGYGIGELDL